MDTISINGNIKGKNIAIGSNSKIIEVTQKNIREDKDQSREEIIEQLDKIEKMIIENRSQLNNAISLGQEITALREEINIKNINKNVIETKLSKLESGVKSIANIASAVNTIKTLILTCF
jgi:hypothetical protein